MVQSSSVLREPSMDEILTSIREIIEENAVHPDYFSNEGAAGNSSRENLEIPSEGVYDTSLSVDDAMKALADRIGLSSENHDFSLTKDKESIEAENNTVGVDMQKMKRSSEEQSSVHRTQEHNKPFSQSENVIAGHVELSAYCISSAEKIAKDVLRPAIAEWLQHKLPVLLEDILREEIVRAIKKSS
ncbi:DUF2497 domain-containing protein [Bartonella henselae]|uniref:DUF2497 domain-containing protein n=1 Tax=Bartonella henselae (strain ATCC 49882 / DSM 28221 / CCUG 30454 / Houston 1) TaxID=283166 RepID=A0A0H3M3N3_BARHE|nr:DUF2497 domain-containing protein [Bartonella henselae]ATP12568.1 hypothetical protein BhenCHDE101_05415 [Bartonella henselae]ETS08181.1 hypothetical protein Q654_01049 [Bartonella henselae JK 50]ETS08729.1 hypothetical protein Q655_01002 [Bartonella henselae JK 51]MDM9991399.1 DUF2497 domain-containing protein [Bartonella henselae]OLL41293.1 hypothetical protein AT237_05935 [Bartonella henselae]